MENRINYLSPIASCMAIGLMFTVFTQSCGVTRAGISNTLSSSTIETPISKKQALTAPENDSPVKIKILSSPKEKDSVTVLGKVIVPDSILNSPSLYNERLSLENQQKIIDLLIQKDNEVRKLNDTVAKLSAKTMVTNSQKIDAVSMEAVWQMGKYILTASCVIIGLMLVLIMVLLNNKRYRKIQTI